MVKKQQYSDLEPTPWPSRKFCTHFINFITFDLISYFQDLRTGICPSCLGYFINSLESRYFKILQSKLNKLSVNVMFSKVLLASTPSAVELPGSAENESKSICRFTSQSKVTIVNLSESENILIISSHFVHFRCHSFGNFCPSFARKRQRNFNKFA